MQNVDIYKELCALVPLCDRCEYPLYTVSSVIRLGKPTGWRIDLCSKFEHEVCFIHCRCYV